MLARIKETDENVPYKQGQYFYYTRTEQGKQYPIYCRKKGDLKAPEEITLDLNEMSKGHQFFSIGAYNVSDDGNLLAFSSDTTGFRQYADVKTCARAGSATTPSACLLAGDDNRTLFYTQEDAQRNARTIFFVLPSEQQT